MIKHFKQNKNYLLSNYLLIKVGLFCLLLNHPYVLANTKTLTLVSEYLPPFQLVDSNKKITGFATDVVRAVLNKTPYKYNIGLHPWSQSYEMAQKNKNTCIYSIVRKKYRKKLFQWIGQITTTNTYFVSQKSNYSLKVNSIDDAKHYMTAVIKNDFTHQTLIRDGFIRNKNYYVINNSDSLLQLLISRRNIDLVLIDSLTMNYRIMINGFDPKLFVTHVQLNQQPLRFYLACSNTTEKSIVDTLRKAFETIEQNGDKQKIMTTWMQKDVGVLRD